MMASAAMTVASVENVASAALAVSAAVKAAKVAVTSAKTANNWQPAKPVHRAKLVMRNVTSRPTTAPMAVVAANAVNATNVRTATRRLRRKPALAPH